MLGRTRPESIPSLFSEWTDHRVLLRLAVTKSNRSAIGAPITVTAGGVIQFDEVRRVGSYLSSNEGGEIEWSSNGFVETLQDFASDMLYEVVEVERYSAEDGVAYGRC
jgi:hypothetical protein